jgi:uncharacterized protein (TIGR02246 family)
MKCTLMSLFAVVCLSATPPSRSQSPESVVMRQLEAYNAHDVEAFAATYAEDAELYEFPAQLLEPKGKEGLKARYARLFKENPDLHANAKAQMLAGGYVIHKEKVTGLAGRKEALEAVAIYLVKDGLISKVWLMKP